MAQNQSGRDLDLAQLLSTLSSQSPNRGTQSYGTTANQYPTSYGHGYPGYEQNPRQYPPGQYPPGQYPPGQFPLNQFTPNQSTPNQFTPNQFSQNQFSQHQFTPNQFKSNQSPPNQFSQNQFPQNQFVPNQFAPNQSKPNQSKPNQFSYLPSSTVAPYYHNSQANPLNQNFQFSQEPKKEPDLQDPRTITAWDPAMEFVAHIKQQDNLKEKIRNMIKRQHDQENHWMELRQRRQKIFENRRKVEETLKALDAPTEVIRHEDKVYDKQIHYEARQMMGEIMKELAKLRIPFFGTKAELIIEDTVLQAQKKPQQFEGSESKKITRRQLRSLQKKMIVHLEHVYGAGR